VIMNPPYKKIASDSIHRLAMKKIGLDTVNLYSGFMAAAIKQLVPGGELVAIVPRSFCNGPYYHSFRELLFSETVIRHIHIFDSRSNAFSEDKVLQENIILHCVKGGRRRKVRITSSPKADFHFDKRTNSISATDKTTRTIPYSSIVNENDLHKFLHIASNN
jgi:adenine-specific DNA-methyltransferase